MQIADLRLLRTFRAMNEVPDGLRSALAASYAIERPIGQGGMATVYLARDAKHGRKVAIKVMRPDLAASLGTERFPLLASSGAHRLTQKGSTPNRLSTRRVGS